MENILRKTLTAEEPVQKNHSFNFYHNKTDGKLMIKTILMYLYHKKKSIECNIDLVTVKILEIIQH